MAHESPVCCSFCHASLKPGELAVFREGAKIAHVQCWRPPKNDPVDEIETTRSSEQPDGAKLGGAA